MFSENLKLEELLKQISDSAFITINNWVQDESGLKNNLLYKGTKELVDSNLIKDYRLCENNNNIYAVYDSTNKEAIIEIFVEPIPKPKVYVVVWTCGDEKAIQEIKPSNCPISPITSYFQVSKVFFTIDSALEWINKNAVILKEWSIQEFEVEM